VNEIAIIHIREQIDALTNEGKALVITDNASYEVAGEFLKRVKSAQKQVDDTRKGMTRPIDEAKKKIMDLFRPIENRTAEIEASLKKSMLDYQIIQQKRLAAELDEKRKQDEAEREQAAKDAAFFGEAEPDPFAEVPVASVPAIVNVPPVVSGVSTRTAWTYEITDESLIPREFLSVDESKIRADIALGKRDIAGVKIFQKTIISARG
jgi:hypothetical protein